MTCRSSKKVGSDSLVIMNASNEEPVDLVGGRYTTTSRSDNVELTISAEKTPKDLGLDIDFFGQRGVFCRLLRAVETPDRMEILVTLCNGTYYMETFKVKPTSAVDANYCFKNFKRHLALVEGAHPDINLSDDSYYSAVMKTQCERYKLILSYGVDAERDNPDLVPPGNYIDIKTRYQINSEQNKNNFRRYTTLKWWSQAVIAGIPEVICGWRENKKEQVILSSVELMKTEHLPLRAPMMTSGRRFWEADACFETFQTLLDNIKDLIKEDDPRIVHRLELPEVMKGKGVKKRLQARRFKLLEKRQDDYAILPEWYLREVLWIENRESKQ
ncbi:decapping and exoribonuclease protein-like [Lytechinus variegatus]|uniref:decapping and exoribonuclease protein-like n=1 Tax=Lytechinus variegatus TaxID=7654 RepID=UPI001BB27F57|nr:decapping and exoribonuclease protein-like [Lytechinus variegatus]